MIQHPDPRIIGVQQIAGHDVAPDLLDQWQKQLHGAAAPVDEGCVRNVRRYAGEDPQWVSTNTARDIDPLSCKSPYPPWSNRLTLFT